MTTTKTFATLVAVGLLTVSCTATPPQASPTTDVTVPSTGTQAPIDPDKRIPPGASTSAPTTDNSAALAAIATAQASLSGRAVDLEWDDDGWEVDVLVGSVLHDLRVVADGSQVIRTDDDPDEVDAEGLTRIGESTITMERAIETALAAHPGRLSDADLDDDNREWDIDIDDRDIRVDAQSGAIKS